MATTNWAGSRLTCCGRGYRPVPPAQKFADGLELLEYLDGYDTAVLIDASSPAGKPGSIRSFTWPCPGSAWINAFS